MANSINWFEIPAVNLDRGAQFYSTLFGAAVNIMDFGGVKMAMLPSEQGDVSGALIKHESYEASPKAGVLIYLNGGNDLQVMLDKVEGAGGQVIQPKTQISPEVGYMALFIDSEGNRMALHSPS